MSQTVPHTREPRVRWRRQTCQWVIDASPIFWLAHVTPGDFLFLDAYGHASGPIIHYFLLPLVL